MTNTKKFKLTKDMNLIKIYEDGNFEEFKSQYNEMLENIDRYSYLTVHFLKEYFPELLNEFHVKDGKLFIKNYEKYNKLHREYGVNIPKELANSCYEEYKLQPKDKVTKDPLYEEFVNVSKKVLWKQKPLAVKNHKQLADEVNDPIMKDTFAFAKQFILYDLVDKKYNYITYVEEAKESGYEEVYDFVDEITTDEMEKAILKKRVALDFRKIRESLNLDLKEFCKLLKCDEKGYTKIESGKVQADGRSIKKAISLHKGNKKDIGAIVFYHKWLQKRNKHVHQSLIERIFFKEDD